MCCGSAAAPRGVRGSLSAPAHPWEQGKAKSLSVTEEPVHVPAQGMRSREQGTEQETIGSYFRQVNVVLFLLLQQRVSPLDNKHPELLTDAWSYGVAHG